MTRMNSDAPTVLLTGASGFVGSRIARRLAPSERQVRAIVRRLDIPERSDPGLATIEWIEGDFTDAALAEKAMAGVDAVVHAAATVGPDMETARRVNTEGTRTLVEAALREGVRRYVQISTLSVYADRTKDRIDEDAPLRQDDHPYGTSKAEADRVVLDGIERGLPGVILRPGAILGVHPTSTWGVVLPGRIRTGEMKIRGDGREPMPWVHVENLVDAVLLALENDRAVGRVYNVADRSVSWKAYTDEVRQWFDAPPLESIPPSEFGGYGMGRFDASRLTSELGYRPARTYEDGMAEAAAHWSRERAPHP